jgi:hypothetical protein
MQLLPDRVASALLEAHDRCVYQPLNTALSALAARQEPAGSDAQQRVLCLDLTPPLPRHSEWFPRWLSPNAVTIAAGVCLVPCLRLLRHAQPASLAAAGETRRLPAF